MTRSLLFVDDFQDTRETLGELLAMEGWDVRTAGSGSEAIAHMEERHALIIWIDEDLYDFRGIDLAFHLKAIVEKRYPGEKCVTIAVTGFYTPDEKVELPGFDHVVSKPVDFKKIDNLLAKYCAQPQTKNPDLGLP